VRPRDLDLTALLAGIVFLVAGVAAVASTVSGAELDPRWAMPLLLVGLGLAGIASTVRGRRQR
jgi:hypothetical protein